METEIAPSEPTVAEIATVAPSVSELVQAAPTPAPIEKEVVSAEAPASKKEVVAETEAPEYPPSLIGDAISAEKDEKPKEEATPKTASEEEKKEEAITEEIKPAEPIVYEEFKFPEGAKVDKEEINKFTDVIGKYNLTQEAAQELVDMHVNAVQSITKQAHADQWQVFNDQQKEWRTQIMADPVLGGSGHQTAMQKVGQAVETVIKDPDRIKAFQEALAVTGAGNNPEIVRFVHDVHKYTRQGEILNTPIGAPPDIGPKPKTKAALMYDNTNFDK